MHQTFSQRSVGVTSEAETIQQLTKLTINLFYLLLLFFLQMSGDNQNNSEFSLPSILTFIFIIFIFIDKL